MADGNEELEEVRNMLENHPSLKIVTNKKDKLRVVCELTSHEMPCTLNSVKTYINGKKYKFETENKLTTEEQELHEKYLVLKKRGQLFCTLTKRHINNVSHHIRIHLRGRRFQKALKNANTGKSLHLERMSRDSTEKEIKVKDEGMWVPSDSESESLENELGSDFDPDEGVEDVDTPEDTYSFDILDVKSDSTVAEDTSVNKPINQKKSKRKCEQAPKRKAKHRKTELGQNKKEKCV